MEGSKDNNFACVRKFTVDPYDDYDLPTVDFFRRLRHVVLLFIVERLKYSESFLCHNLPNMFEAKWTAKPLCFYFRTLCFNLM